MATLQSVIGGAEIDVKTSDDGEIVLSRRFDAPRELVFKAWTEPERLKQWWAPEGCTIPFCRVDLRVGGDFHFCMRMADGRDVWGLGVYREIVPPERIVYVDSFADADGNPVSPMRHGMSPEHPAETLVTVTFTDEGSGTRLTLHHTIPSSTEEYEGAVLGWSEMLEQLADMLA